MPLTLEAGAGSGAVLEMRGRWLVNQDSGERRGGGWEGSEMLRCDAMRCDGG